MRVGTYKKIFIIAICVTALLALCVYLLPIDSLLVGYSSRNGVGGVTLLPKMEGLGVLCMMPLTAACLWFIRKCGLLNSDNYKIGLDGTSFVCLFLSPMGAVMLLINLFRYLISII